MDGLKRRITLQMTSACSGCLLYGYLLFVLYLSFCMYDDDIFRYCTVYIEINAYIFIFTLTRLQRVLLNNSQNFPNNPRIRYCLMFL